MKKNVAAKHPLKLIEDAKRKQEELDKQAKSLLPPEKLQCFVKETALKLYTDRLYPEAVRDKFKDFSITDDEAKIVFETYKDLVIKFKDPEKYLPSFHLVSEDASNALSEKLDSISYQLMIMELATKTLRHLTKPQDDIQGEVPNLNEKEMAGLQYLSGHVIHKTFSKLRTQIKWRNYQKSLAILKAFKTEPNENHKLVAAKDLGGLWYIRVEGEKIFKAAEYKFRYTTRGFVRKIDEKKMINELVKQYFVKNNFQIILDECNIDKDEITSNLLEKIVGLYRRVRCHSYAKDIKEKHKIVKKTAGQKRSLRGTLKQIEQEHEKNI